MPVQYERTARPEGKRPNKKYYYRVITICDILLHIIAHFFTKTATFAAVNKEVIHFALPTCFKGACHKANQQDNHSIFFKNDLLHQITGSIITG